MKTIKLFFLLLVLVIVCLTSTPSFSHVIPEDELQNKVYMTARQALQKVFAGVHRINKKTKKLSPSQQLQAEKLLNHKVEDFHIDFFTAEKDGRKVFATIGKAYANSHPVTEAMLIVSMDAQGRAEECHIMEYRGPQRAEIISRDFLDQFLGKSADSDFTTITSNQGSTPPVQALSLAVHRTLVLYKVLYLDSSN